MHTLYHLHCICHVFVISLGAPYKGFGMCTTVWVPDYRGRNHKMASLKQQKPSFEYFVKECVITSVIVYRDRAEVKRSLSVTIPRGECDVIFKGLPEVVDSNSIR